jgi:hypothetical protein
MAKLSLLVGFGAGYVLGARAGRERYEQIAGKVQKLWHDPRVQEKADQVEQIAKEKAGQVEQAVKDKTSSSSSGSHASSSTGATGTAGTAGTTGATGSTGDNSVGGSNGGRLP